MRPQRAALWIVLAAAGCSKAPGRSMSFTVKGGKPTLNVFCDPGDRVRVESPVATAERRCAGKELKGGEVFPLTPSAVAIGHNKWAAALISAKGAKLPLLYEFDYAPTAEDAAHLFQVVAPTNGSDVVALPPVVAAPFLPGAPQAEVAVDGGVVQFGLQAPIKTRIDVGGVSFAVEPGLAAQAEVALGDLLAERELSEACAPLEVEAKVTRSDGVAYDGKLVVSRATPRLLAPVDVGPLAFVTGHARPHTALIVRDDGTCWAMGSGKVSEVAMVVTVDQLRHDLEPCPVKGKGKTRSEIARVAYDVAVVAYDPRTGKRRGEKALFAPQPSCSRLPPVKPDAGPGGDAVLLEVEPSTLKKWAGSLMKR
jgi:hypothetical protein